MDQERPTQAIQTQEGWRLTCAHKIDSLVHNLEGWGGAREEEGRITIGTQPLLDFLHFLRLTITLQLSGEGQKSTWKAKHPCHHGSKHHHHCRSPHHHYHSSSSSSSNASAPSSPSSSNHQIIKSS